MSNGELVLFVMVLIKCLNKNIFLIMCLESVGKCGVLDVLLA